MDFGSIEEQIAGQLITVINDETINIIPVPEDEQEILPSFGKRQIIVAFSSEDADADENTSVVIQNTHVTFAVLLQGKKLRGDTGLYELAEAVKLALTGFIPTDCRELTYDSHKFVKNEKKVFEYLLNFKTQGTRVQNISEDTVGAGAFQGATYIPAEGETF